MGRDSAGVNLLYDVLAFRELGSPSYANHRTYIDAERCKIRSSLRVCRFHGRGPPYSITVLLDVRDLQAFQEIYWK